jgi:hypothetical protein
MSDAELPVPNKPTRLDQTQFARATKAAVEAGQQIAKDSWALTRRERLGVANAFRRHVLLPGRPGRKRSNRITAAHADWKTGMRGVALYRKHIRGWEKHNFWRRKSEARTLMDAIRTRERREQRSAEECLAVARLGSR